MSQSFDYSQSTIEYYNKNALSYYEQTVNIDMSDIYEPFLELIPKGGHILDAGCGSGRDTKEFLCRGYKVTAIDASEEMVKLSSQLTEQKTMQMRFQDLAFDQQFDGIWACASLLHIPRNEISLIIQKFINITRPNSTWYISFKLGTQEVFLDGRLYNNYDESLIESLLADYSFLRTVKVWQTISFASQQKLVKWLNVLVVNTKKS